MTPAATLAAPCPAPSPGDAPASARARIERQMARLDRLAEIGMEIAEACGRDARAMAAAANEADAAPAPEPRREHSRDLGLVFARVARAVRMTIALEQRLAGDLADLDRAELRAQQDRTAKRRRHLGRLIQAAAEASVEARRAAETPAQAWARRDDPEAVEDEIDRVADEAYERLIEAEAGDPWGGSFDEVVAAVARDLGLSADGCARLRRLVAAPPPHPPPEPLAPVILGGSAPRNRAEAGPRIDSAAQTRSPGPANLDEGASRAGDDETTTAPPRAPHPP
jgi:hypothetical protein